MPQLHQDSQDCSEIYQIIYFWCFKSLAKLLHGIAALASILFAQTACRGLKLTSAPPVST